MVIYSYIWNLLMKTAYLILMVGAVIDGIVILISDFVLLFQFWEVLGAH